MVTGDVELLLVGVARQLDDLHPVEQRAWDGARGVGGGDEEDVGQVERQLDEVVAEGAVLFGVQDLQQGRGRVAAHVGPDLVDLIEEQERVARPGLPHGVHDPPGHGADVGLAVAADVGLVVDAAEGDPRELAVERPRHGHPDGRLADAGRADEAEHLALQVWRELLDGQELQDALLDGLQAVMVGVEDLARGGDVDALLGLLVPGQLQAGVEVVAQDGRLRRAERLLLQVDDLLEELLLDLLGELRVGDLAAVAGRLALAVLAQLLLDDADLLAQEGVLLVLGHVLLDAPLDALLHLQDLHLAVEQPVHLVQTLDRSDLIEDGLLVQHTHRDVLGDEVRDIAGVLARHDVHEHLGVGVLRGQVGVAVEQLVGLPDGGLGAQGVGLPLVIRLLLDLIDLGDQVGIGLAQGDQAGAVAALDHDPDRLPRQPEDLAHVGDGADVEEMVAVRRLHADVLLGHEEDRLIGGHGLLERLDGGLTAHVEVDHHFRIYREPSQREGRHGAQVQIFGQDIHFLSCSSCPAAPGVVDSMAEQGGGMSSALP